MALTFSFEPIESDVADDAERATWGALQIAVDGRIVTQVRDRYTHDVRGHVYDTVLPLAEWVARNWIALTGVVWPPPAKHAPRRASYDWRRSHRFRMVGQGVALPDLALWRSDEQLVTVDVQPDDGAGELGERVAFLAKVRAVLPLSQVRSALAELVDSALRRCQDRAPDHPRTLELARTWSEACGPDAASRQQARWAAGAGLSWAHLSDEERATLARLVSAVPPWLHPALLAMDGSQLEPIPTALLQAREQLARAPAWDREAVALQQHLVPSTASTVWERGWADAFTLRRALALPDDAPCPLDALPPGGVQGDPASLPLQDSGDAVVAWDADRQPVRWIRKDNTFRAVRDRWAALFGRTDRGPGCVGVGPRGAARSTANAFAAELLAPRRAIELRLDGARTVQPDDIDDIAAAIGAPSQCVALQIRNHDLAERLRW